MIGRIARIAVFVAAAAHAAAASEVRVSFTTPLDAKPVDGPVTVHARSEAGAEKTAEMTLSSGGAIALEPGLWELKTKSSRYWTRPATMNVGADATTIALPAFRTIDVKGSVSVPTVNELTIGFAPPPSDPPSPIPSATISCPIKEAKFACAVPMGLLDLTFRATGYVALYRWNEKLTENRDVGLLTLRKGSSFSGTVTFAERQPKKAPEITVSVWARSPAAQNDAEKARVALARQNATPNARGFFQFALPPGDYTVQPTAVGGLTSEKRDLQVLEGRESRLRTPLVLERPHALTLHIDPPKAPYGTQWKASLTSTDKSGAVDFDAHADVPENGVWRLEGLYSDHYTLNVRRGEDDAWFSSEIDVSNADVDIDAKVPMTKLSGHVTLAGKPLVANVWFSDGHGKNVGIRSRADGTFGPVLFPLLDGDTWASARVQAEQPFVERTLRKVKLTTRGDDREVDIEVKGATIFGDVVDPAGVVQTNALVTAMLQDRTVAQVESPSGTFVYNAVAPGRIALSASTRGGETSGSTEVMVSGDESTEVHLVVKPGSVVDAVVRSLNGSVGGAGIASVSLSHWADFLSQQAADPEGRFSIHLPPGAAGAVVSVNAPGYAYRILRLPPRSDVPVPVIVETSGGALSFSALQDGHDGTITYLIHGGALLPVHIAAWLGGADTDAAGHSTIAMAEEGAYSVCRLTAAELVAAADGFRPDGRCATGLLARGGVLALETPH